MDFNGKLENGVELYTSLNPALRGFCLSLWVRRGSMHDEHHGLAHMLEHVTFRCISERMGGRLYETLARLGLDFDASTFTGYVRFEMSGPVERFREAGFAVWMDDFGSGYSSLDVLRDIHFDLIKFDMSFLRKLDEGDKGKIILRELMKLAGRLNLDTVCEGVEKEEHVRFLQEINCSKLQGYYFGKPAPWEPETPQEQEPEQPEQQAEQPSEQGSEQ